MVGKLFTLHRSNSDNGHNLKPLPPGALAFSTFDAEKGIAALNCIQYGVRLGSKEQITPGVARARMKEKG
jgi:hypothetical protein